MKENAGGGKKKREKWKEQHCESYEKRKEIKRICSTLHHTLTHQRVCVYVWLLCVVCAQSWHQYSMFVLCHTRIVKFFAIDEANCLYARARDMFVCDWRKVKEKKKCVLVVPNEVRKVKRSGEFEIEVACALRIEQTDWRQLVDSSNIGFFWNGSFLCNAFIKLKQNIGSKSVWVPTCDFALGLCRLVC